MKKVITLLVVCLTAGAANAAMLKGPYLIYPGDNTKMMVLWQLDVNETCTLSWGEDTSYADGNVVTTEYGSDHQHKHTITNLTPGTKYYYQVTEDVNHTGTFYAAPPNSANSVKFFAYGDTRNHPERQSNVAGRIITEYTSDPNYQTFSLFSGDWVDKGKWESDWTRDWFNRSYANLMEIKANLPINGCIGNHEVFPQADPNSVLFLKYYPYPYVADTYWSFDYGPAHFTVLAQYNNAGGQYAKINSAQLTWIENDLATTDKEWKFILLHAPGWSAGDHSNNSDVQNNIQPLCEAYRVDMIIAGHNHNYARAEVNCVTHITTGGGGATSDPVSFSYPYVVAAESAYHFCMFDIQGDDLFFKAVRTNGTIIESFHLRHYVRDYVDFNDVKTMGDNWLGSCTDPNWCEDTDIDESNSVNFIDFAWLGKYWSCWHSEN